MNDLACVASVSVELSDRWRRFSLFGCAKTGACATLIKVHRTCGKPYRNACYAGYEWLSNIDQEKRVSVRGGNSDGGVYSTLLTKCCGETHPCFIRHQVWRSCITVIIHLPVKHILLHHRRQTDRQLGWEKVEKKNFLSPNHFSLADRGRFYNDSWWFRWHLVAARNSEFCCLSHYNGICFADLDLVQHFDRFGITQMTG